MTTPPFPSTAGYQKNRFHTGAYAWVGQRLSGLALVPLSIWFLGEMGRHCRADYFTVSTWVAQPWIGLSLAVFIAMVFYHSALGLQVILEDYVSHLMWRRILILKVKAFCLVLTLVSWCSIIFITYTAPIAIGGNTP